jgi:hypothetical protein
MSGDQLNSRSVRGCALFALLFLVGAGLIIGGLVYGVLAGQNTEESPLPARIMQLVGVIILFGAVFGAAAWAFYRRLHDPEDEVPEGQRRNPP